MNCVGRDGAIPLVGGDFTFDRVNERTVATGVTEKLNSSITASKALNLNVSKTIDNGTLSGNSTVTPPSQSQGNIQQTESITVTAPQMTFPDSNGVTFPTFVYPSNPNGLFVLSPDPKGKYLIETNPALTNMGLFLGSDYFMERVGFNPEKDVKFLGDAFYDTRMISQSIFEQTGQHYLNNSVGSALEQMRQLIDAAGDAQQSLNLVTGIALTAEQIASLTQDIVWYEEIEVNGQTVLAPKLYLAQATLESLSTGALLAGGEVSIDAGNVVNSGSIEAQQNLTINSQDTITNLTGNIQSQGDMALTAQNDLINQSGTISGENITLSSIAGSIINETLVETQTGTLGRNSATITDVGATAFISAGGSLTLNAGHNVENLGSTMSAGNDLSVSAGNDIVVSAIEKTDGHETSGRRIHDSEMSTSQLGSELTSGGELTLTAGNDITVTASDVAANDSLSLTAGNDVLIQTAQNTNTEQRSDHKTTTIDKSVSHQGSTLSGNNVSISSGNDTTLSGSSIHAQESASIAAKGDINILAVNDSEYHYDKTHDSKSFGRSKTTINETYQETAQGSSINAGNNITLSAQNLSSDITAGGDSDINIIGSELNAGGQVNVSADGDITLAAQTYKEFERHETIKEGFGGLSGSHKGSIDDATLLGSSYVINGGDVVMNSGKSIGVIASEVVSDGSVNLEALNEVLIAAGDVLKQSQSWDEETKFLSGGNLFEMNSQRDGEQSTTAQSSTIQAGNNLNINAGSITVIGSELTASNDVSLTADTGDINILAAQESTSSYSNQESLSITMFDGLSNPDIKVEDGQVKISIGEAQYDKVDTQTDSTAHVGSQISAGNNLSLDAESSILIEGSELAANSNDDGQGDLTLAANDDITIKEVVDTARETQDEVHGSAEASVVVQHQAVEVAKAAMAVEDSRKALKQAEQDYKEYKKGLDNLEATLAALKDDYAQRKPGVNYADIEELQDLISQVKGDEAWYVTGIALATTDLTSKITLLAQQSAAAVQSSGTYGFNAGVHLDIAASQTSTNTQQTTSQGSSLAGNNITISAGNQANIQGSSVTASDTLTLTADEINITASQDTFNQRTQNEEGNIGASMTVYGASSGINLNASLSRSESESSSLTHTNSQLSGNTIVMNSNQDTNIKGGNIAATDHLDMTVGGDLNIESVQDRHNSSHKGAGISGGLSLSGGEVPVNENGDKGGFINNADGNAGNLTGVSGGLNASTGRTNEKDTLLSSITSGNTAEITVAGNTDIKGALIGTVDEAGNDLGNLSLTTDSLTYTDLTNSHYSQDKSMGLNSSVGAQGGEIDATYNTSNLQYSNSSSYSKDKTLATLGEGNLTINNTENSDDLTALNRDTTNTNKELFEVERTEGNIDVTLDHRLLTEEGRNKIDEDFLISDMFRESLARALSTERVGLTDVFSETGKQLDVYNKVKETIGNDPNLAAQLQDPNLSPEVKQSMLDQLTRNAMQALGHEVEGYENKIIAQNDDERLGFYSHETKDSYINDELIDDTKGLVTVAGHEMSHAVDHASGDLDKYSQEDRETYADYWGKDLASYTDTALGVSGYGDMASSNNHVGNSGSTVTNNNAEYAGLDKSKGDSFPLAIVIPSVVTAVVAGIAASPKEQEVTKTAVSDALQGLQDIGADIAAFFEPEAKYTDAELDVAAQSYLQMMEYRDTSANSGEWRTMDELMQQVSPDVVARAELLSAQMEIAETIPMPGGSEIVDSGITILTTPEFEDKGSNILTTPSEGEPTAWVTETPTEQPGADLPLVVSSEESELSWTQTNNKSSSQNALGHWEKHGSEFPELENVKQYVEAAQSFMKTPPEGTLTRIRANGDIVRYHAETNTFGVMTKDGALRTMFKPEAEQHGYENNLEYFNAQ